MCKCAFDNLFLSQQTIKTFREKVTWEPHKDIACCLEHILEAAPSITAVV